MPTTPLSCGFERKGRHFKQKSNAIGRKYFFDIRLETVLEWEEVTSDEKLNCNNQLPTILLILPEGICNKVLHAFLVEALICFHLDVTWKILIY